MRAARGAASSADTQCRVSRIHSQSTSGNAFTIAQRHGPHQAQFAKDLRSETDPKQHKCFHAKDWRNVTQLGGKHIALSSPKKIVAKLFCVKSVTVWVPHLLIPDCVPSCPNRKSNKHVEVVSSRWVKCPKLLFLISSHKHLDTKFCPCHQCNKEFTGHNKQSLSLDATTIIGHFNFYLSTECAVEEELCSFIVDSPDAPSARIARHLEKIAVDNHLQDCQLCLHAVRAQRIKCGPSKNVSLFDTSQLTIAAALEEQIKKVVL